MRCSSLYFILCLLLGHHGWWSQHSSWIFPDKRSCNTPSEAASNSPRGAGAFTNVCSRLSFSMVTASALIASLPSFSSALDSSSVLIWNFGHQRSLSHRPRERKIVHFLSWLGISEDIWSKNIINLTLVSNTWDVCIRYEILDIMDSNFWWFLMWNSFYSDLLSGI
jgi:hypothetical protein